MTRPPVVAGLLALFLVLATANSGGYRYGVSDQAFYVPAVALDLHGDLFPRDRALLTPQLRLWPGGALLAGAARLTRGDLPTLFAGLYVVTLIALGMAAIALSRALGGDDWTTAAFVLLLTFRHRIAKTGANSLEGYAHPRMLAFAIGLGSLAAIARRRWLAAWALAAVAVAVHPTTGAWFAAVLVLAAVWSRPRRGPWIGMLAAGGAMAAAALVWLAPGRFVVMDQAWLAVLADKDYLFPAAWPAYAWVTNLAYVGVLLLVHARRRRLDLAGPGETGLVMGLVALVVIFLVSVPIAQARIALVVQLQINRVFWLLDAVVAWHVAWVLCDWTAGRPHVGRWPRGRLALVAVLLTVSAARGAYILAVEARRPLAQLRLPADGWTDVMRWVGTQPVDWLVLADPGHAWKYGSSVRVAALRDTVLEAGKDTAMAMYDRAAALRVAARQADLAGFDDFTADDFRRLDERYGVDVVIEPTSHPVDLPVLYRNADFIAYDLR